MTAEEDPIVEASKTRRERLSALRAAKEYHSMPDDAATEDEAKADGRADDHVVVCMIQNAVKSTEEAKEEEGIGRRAIEGEEKEASVLVGRRRGVDADKEKTPMQMRRHWTLGWGEMDAEEDPIEQAASARRERIKALKMAKELLDTPDEEAAKQDSKTEDSEDE
ncbi:hypothetical protein BHE74_00012736 [Ensete ventricosum]|nr:hypothetical protein BHE74_00012736 [Ensete ventricosum]RZS04213.1 hypothetical protein BHM03_00034504 [Ensete ventricosum]